MSDSSAEFENVDVTGSPIGYKKETVIDTNSNIDHRYYVAKPVVASLGSPRLTRSVHEQRRNQSDTPLVVFNRGYSPLKDYSLESSPEFSLKNYRDQSLSNQGSLRVRVDHPPPPIQPQQSHSSLESSESDSPRYWEPPERRDSGVGSSLSRSPRLAFEFVLYF